MVAAYEVEVWSPDLEDWVELEPDGVTVEWGMTRPPTLRRDGRVLPERFRLYEVVSAGTDRVLRIEAISGFIALVGPFT